MDFETLKTTLGPWIGNRYVQSLLILVGSVVTAKIVDLIIAKFVVRITGKTQTDLDDKIVATLHHPVFYTVVLGGVGLAAHQLRLPSGIEFALLGIIKTAAIVVWVQATTRVASLCLDFLSLRESGALLLEKSTRDLFDNVARIVLFGGACYFVLLSWDIDVSGWLASAGLVAMAVGLGAQDTIANLFAGVFILADKPYKVGHVLSLDSGERGEVTSIGLRSTRILTRDDTEVSIPNSVMAQAKITNETGGPSTSVRARVRVGVAYGSDVDQVEALLLEIAAQHQGLCKDPPPQVRFRAFGDSSLDFELLGWIRAPELRGLIVHELNKAVYKAFAAENIEIPYPKRDVYLHNVEP